MEEHKSPSKSGEVTPKKVYQSPSFRFERVFEVSALSCGKVQDTQAGCHEIRKLS
jgi:hypothetical protein